jgi:hypothetical protein
MDDIYNRSFYKKEINIQTAPKAKVYNIFRSVGKIQLQLIFTPLIYDIYELAFKVIKILLLTKHLCYLKCIKINFQFTLVN